MVQKEVAKKFSASVGDKEFGSLAILAQSVAEAKILFEVEPQAFIPPPKVTSTYIPSGFISSPFTLSFNKTGL